MCVCPRTCSLLAVPCLPPPHSQPRALRHTTVRHHRNRPVRRADAAQFYKWADEYLDAHVLDSMEDLFFDEAEQPEAAQGGGAPG